MKNSTIIPTIILLLTVLFTSSCKKWVDQDLNVDPNRPTDVTVTALLPVAQAGMGYTAGGDVKYAASIWMQQMAGGANQPLAYDRYVFTQSDVDNVWTYGLYSGPMMDCYQIIEKANAEGSPYYSGIAKVMMAYQLGCVTDLWGSAPYSEAFQGNANLKPGYDSQQEIYPFLINLLDAAIADFSLGADENFRLPGGDDLIYGGDVTLWTRATYALKARYALHLSKRNPNAYAEALVALANAFSSNDQDFEFTFGSAYSENSPLFQFNDQRTFDIVTGANLVDSLVARNDPRLPLLVDSTDGYIGSHAGEGDGWALIGPYYASPNSPVPFISYVECKFIEAEALLPTDAISAATAFNDAVKASLAKFGVSDSLFEATWAAETGATLTLQKIIEQKYYALCYQLEVYNDWRRTGFPVLQKSNISAISEIPRRYPYPTSERLYNSENVPNVTLTTRVWWDE